MDMLKLYIMRGIPASGKTTTAKKLVTDNPNTVRYSWDDLRNMMGKYWDIDRERLPFLKESRNQFLDFWMTSKWNIVIDNTNLNSKDEIYYTNIINSYNQSHTTKYDLEYINCFTPVEECIRRDKLRSNPIGEKVIRDFWKRYKQLIISIQHTEFNNNQNNIDISKENAIIVDLDGTIALNYILQPFYNCKDLIKDNKPIRSTINIVENYKGVVIFVTGRSEESREATTNWISNNMNINTYKLLMREEGNLINSADLKEKIYKEQIQPYYNIDFALEDSEEVIERYKKLKIFTLKPIL